MAGHSQYKNIMHRKGRQDKIRSNAFAKLGREITVATKAGLPDPGHECPPQACGAERAGGKHALGHD